MPRFGVPTNIVKVIVALGLTLCLMILTGVSLSVVSANTRQQAGREYTSSLDVSGSSKIQMPGTTIKRQALSHKLIKPNSSRPGLYADKTLPETQGDSSVCFATHNDGGLVFEGADAQPLRDAVAAAPAGGTVKVAGYCAGVDGNVRLVGISKSLTVSGGYTNTDWLTYLPQVYTPTLDAQNAGRVITIAGNGTVTPTVLLQNLLVTSGVISYNHGAGIAITNAHVTIQQSNIQYNQVISGWGGGIYANQPITINGSIIRHNEALYDDNDAPLFGYGGGLYIAGAKLDSTSVLSNVASYAGGGMLNRAGMLTLNNGSRVDYNDSGAWGGGINNDAGTVLVNDSSQVSHNSSGRGGGIYSRNHITLTTSAYVTLTGNSKVQENWAAFFGGGIFALRNTTDTLTSIALSGNSQLLANRTGFGNGGGIYAWGLSFDDAAGGVMISVNDNSQIISNTAESDSMPKGGGVYLYRHSVITITGGGIISNAAENGGGIYLEQGRVTIENGQINNNQATVYGGGMYIDEGPVNITGGEINYNHAGDEGGGLRLSTQGEVTLNGTLVMSNTASNGGGIYNNSSVLTMHHVILDDNAVTNQGGGIMNKLGTVTIYNSQIINNHADDWAGGVFHSDGGQMIISQTVVATNTGSAGAGIYAGESGTTAQLNLNDVEVFNNSSFPGGGGGLLIREAEVNISQGEIRNNTTSADLSSGGGIFLTGGNLTMTGGQISLNRAKLGGGAIYIDSGSASLTQTIIASNTVEIGGGGAIRNQNDTAVLRIVEGQIISNTAASQGGGILHVRGQSDLIRTTVSNNQGLTGGALRANNGIFNLINSTVSHNTATNNDGGGIYFRNVTVGLTNTTISSNTGTSTIFQDGSGQASFHNTIIANTSGGNNCAGPITFVDNGYNLASDSSCSGLSAGSNITNTNPSLGPLAENGGNSKTHALLVGSPAVDNGLCSLPIDQRGESRPGSTSPLCDIGSFEADFMADVRLSKAVDPSANALPGQTITYTLSFTNAGPDTASGVIITDQIPITLTNVSFVSNKNVVTSGGFNYVWLVEELAADEEGLITITGQISAGLSGPTTFTNSATITSTIIDPVGDNNDDSVFTTVEFEADLTIAKTSIRSDAGTITYSLVITNTGPNLAHGAVVSDVILPGIFSDDDWTWQCSSSNGASCNAGNGTGSLFEVIPSFPSGGVVSYTINATLEEPSSATVINTATISPPVTVNDPVTANNTATDINELFIDDIYLPILFKNSTG